MTKKQGKYLVQTRSQAKTSGITLPKVHGVGKGVDPNVHQKKKQVMEPVVTPQIHISPEKKSTPC